MFLPNCNCCTQPEPPEPVDCVTCPTEGVPAVITVELSDVDDSFDPGVQPFNRDCTGSVTLVHSGPTHGATIPGTGPYWTTEDSCCADPCDDDRCYWGIRCESSPARLSLWFLNDPCGSFIGWQQIATARLDGSLGSVDCDPFFADFYRTLPPLPGTPGSVATAYAG